MAPPLLSLPVEPARPVHHGAPLSLASAAGSSSALPDALRRRSRRDSVEGTEDKDEPSDDAEPERARPYRFDLVCAAPEGGEKTINCAAEDEGGGSRNA